MFKFAIRVIFFTIMILFFISSSTGFFLNKAKVQSFKNIEYKSNPEDITIAIFGSSHAYSSYDPRVFESEFHVNAFNYGAPAQSLITAAPVIREAIEKRNIKLGVVDIFQSSIIEPPFTDRVAAFQYETLDYLKLSLDKINLHNQLYGKENLLNLYPIFRDHALWDERIFQPGYVLSSDIDYYKGFRSELYFDKKSWGMSIDNKEEFDTNVFLDGKELTTGQKEIIDNIINLFQEKKIPLIFVSAPIHKRYMDNTYFTSQQLIKSYLLNKGVTFIDFNDLWDELNLHMFDFTDIGHLNSSGALKVSEYLASYIKNHYDFLGDENNAIKGQLTNRYFHINNGFRKATSLRKIKNTDLKRETGINEIGVFKDNYNRLEIILTGDSIKEINLRVTYEMRDHETRNLPKSIGRKIKGNKYSETISLPNRKYQGSYTGFRYKGKEIKVLLVDCPFPEITNLIISMGNKSPTTQVLKIDQLQLKNSRPTIFQ